MTNKEKYRKFCEKEKNIPIFSKDWWLDTVCGEKNWDVILVEKGEQIVASMPYFTKKKFVFSFIIMPKLTQKLGIYIKYPKNQKYDKKLSFEKEIINEIIKKLPKFDYFKQNFDYKIENWLPLYWNNFEDTTRYTYTINNISDTENIWNNLSNKTRTDIRKAEKKLKVVTSADIKLFYDINKMTFERQNINIPYSYQEVLAIHEICKEHKCQEIFLALDEYDNIHAAIYIIWDEVSAYYIMGGANPKLRNSSAMHLLIWESIKFSSSKVNIYDFEGSMLENVEKFVRSFGAKQKRYFQVYKTNSLIIKLVKFIKEIRND